MKNLQEKYDLVILEGRKKDKDRFIIDNDLTMFKISRETVMYLLMNDEVGTDFYIEKMIDYRLEEKIFTVFYDPNEEDIKLCKKLARKHKARIIEVDLGGDQQ